MITWLSPLAPTNYWREFAPCSDGWSGMRRPRLRSRWARCALTCLKQTASRGKKALHLTAKEFAMLRLMAESPGEPVSRERFLDVVWAMRLSQRHGRSITTSRACAARSSAILTSRDGSKPFMAWV